MKKFKVLGIDNSHSLVSFFVYFYLLLLFYYYLFRYFGFI